MQIPDVGDAADDRLAIQFAHQAQHAVGGRVLRPEVEQHVLGVQIGHRRGLAGHGARGHARRLRHLTRREARRGAAVFRRQLQLLQAVDILQIESERAARLLGPGETPAQRKVLTKWIAFRVVLRHQDPPQIRVAIEADAEHVVGLTFEPVRCTPQLVHAPDPRAVERDRGFDP